MPDPTREALKKAAEKVLLDAAGFRPHFCPFNQAQVELVARALLSAFELIDKQRDALDWVASGMRDTMPLPESTCKIVDKALDGARKVGG